MILNRKLMSLALAGTLLAGALAGCSALPKDGDKDANATPGVTAPTATPGGTAGVRPAGVPEDVTMEVMGIPGSTTLLTVDGTPVDAEEVLYWLSYSADQFNQYGMLDWTMDMDGVTMGDYLLNNAVETAKLHAVVRNHAADAGIALTSEDDAEFQAQLDELKASMAAQLGGEGDQAYQWWLGYIGLTDESFRRVNEISYLVRHLQDGLYGEKGTEVPTPEEYLAWAETNGVYRAKHILVKAADTTEESMAAALETANAIRADLKANGDTEAYFDTVMAEKSEDPGSQSQPDGYIFGSGEMVTEFYDGAKALAEGEISEPVKSSYGYHIILRLPIDPAAQAAKDKYATLQMEATVDQWVADAKVERTADYDKLDPENDYGKLTEVRADIMKAMQAAFAPQETAPVESGTPAPTATPAG